jgi:hypothetical protein
VGDTPSIHKFLASIKSGDWARASSVLVQLIGDSGSAATVLNMFAPPLHELLSDNTEAVIRGENAPHESQLFVHILCQAMLTVPNPEAALRLAYEAADHSRVGTIDMQNSLGLLVDALHINDQTETSLAMSRLFVDHLPMMALRGPVQPYLLSSLHFPVKTALVRRREGDGPPWREILEAYLSTTNIKLQTYEKVREAMENGTDETH